MWAQLTSFQVKPGREHEVDELVKELRAIEQPGSGLVRTTVMQNQQDPTRFHVLAVFDSEQAARARESDPRREEAMGTVRSMMAGFLDGPAAFLDLVVRSEHAT